MEALCDECKRVFTVRPQTVQEGDIETISFTCSHCARVYTVCKTNPRIRDLGSQTERQRQRNGERQRDGMLNKRHIGHLMRKVRKLSSELDALN